MFNEFCKKVGAEFVFVPNLETSTVDEQNSCFADMKNKGIVPRFIELGNEFFFALMSDSEVEKQFPDCHSTMRVMKKYLDGFRKYLPDDAVIATQSAASRFYSTQDVPSEHLLHRRWLWDDELVDEPWFQAVTVHMYPDLDRVVGHEGVEAGLPQRMDEAFPAMIARAEDGLDRMLKDLEQKLPGKAIWITEWNPVGMRHYFEHRRMGFLGIHIHMTIRMLLVLIRRPSVRMCLFHTLSYSDMVSVWRTFTPAPNGKGYLPIGPTNILRWFHETANGEVKYRRINVEGAERIAGNGAEESEGYNDIEAAFFKEREKVTLLIHNASGESRMLRLPELDGGKSPMKVETVETPDLGADFSFTTPSIHSIKAKRDILAPAYSLTKVIFE
jgi:hypothetical protein